jgi:WD40 repeat protein
LNLRGHFAAPQEHGQEQIHFLYRFLHIFPLADIHAILISHNGTAFEDVSDKAILRSISCPSGVLALNMMHSQLALAGQGTIYVWDLRTDQLVHILDSKNGTVTDLALSPDGATLVVAFYENGVQLWRLADGELLYTLQGEDKDYSANKSITLNLDRQLLAIRNFETGDVWLWRVADRQPVQKMDEYQG